MTAEEEARMTAEEEARAYGQRCYERDKEWRERNRERLEEREREWATPFWLKASKGLGIAIFMVAGLLLLGVFWSTFGAAGNLIIAAICGCAFLYWVVTDRG